MPQRSTDARPSRCRTCGSKRKEVIPLLRMRKITVSLVALSLFVAAPAAAAKVDRAHPPKPSKGFADGNTRFPSKGFADGNKGEPA